MQLLHRATRAAYTTGLICFLGIIIIIITIVIIIIIINMVGVIFAVLVV
jgi:hypothetical protein